MNNVEKALRMVLIDCIHSDEFFEDYWRTDILTINTCRNGRDVAWCVWDDGIESCRYIDTLEKLSKEEIEREVI